MPIEIAIVTEGKTEREVGRVLYNRKLLNQAAGPRPTNWRSVFAQPRGGYTQVINALAFNTVFLQPGKRILLIFDQEDAKSEQDRANQIAHALQSKNPAVWQGLSWVLLSSTYTNLFKARQNGACIVLHISNASAHGIQNKDFDGYILQLLQGPSAVDIVQQIIPPRVNLTANALIRKAYIEFTNIMKGNNFPWQRNKAWLYAYITAFQFRNSHVWFAKKVVESAPENTLRQVFASLIYAWDWLINHGGTCS